MVYCAGKRTENLKLFYKSIRPNEAFRESHYKDFKPETALEIREVSGTQGSEVRVWVETSAHCFIFSFFFFAVIRYKQLNMNMLKQQQ